MITVYENRYVSIKNIYGTQNENNVTELEIQIPKQYQDWNKRIVFITDEGNKWDLINGNIYKLKNNITKYQEVYCYIWLTKNSEAEEESIDDFRSETFRLFFKKNEQADDTVPSEEQLDGFNTLITELNLALEEVKNIKSDVEKLKEEVTQTIEDLNIKVETGEFDGATFIPNVDAEGNISWTNDKGLPNPSTQNIKGEKGDQGKQGEQGIPGEKGEQGNPFQIKKTYPSKEAMDLDYPNMQYNDYVMIASNVNDEDNAKLYVKAEGETGWVFITDFSGAQGIQGEKGDKPVKGVDYFTDADKQELVNEVTEDATSSFNQNVIAKTNEFNTNATTKTNDFNDNATAKTEEFNTNAQNKIDEFNQNTEVFENRLTSLEQNDTKQDELIAKLKGNMFNLTAEGTSINVQDSSDLPAVLEVSGGERQTTSVSVDYEIYDAIIVGGPIINKNDLGKTAIAKVKPNTKFKITRSIKTSRFRICESETEWNKINNMDVSNQIESSDLEVEYTTSSTGNYIYVFYYYTTGGDTTIPTISISTDMSSDYPSEVEVVEGNLEINKVNKNWLKILDINETNKNGITYSAKNGILKLKGTSSSAVKIDLAYNVLLPANKYIHSTNIIQKGLYLSLDNLEETMISQSVGIKKNFQISSQTNYNIYFLWIDAGTTVDLELKPQLELGEVATEYAPHESEVYNLPIQQPMLSGDTFVKEDGNWFEVHGWEKYVFTGNEGFQFQKEDEKIISFVKYSVFPNSVDYTGLSNYFKNSKKTSETNNVFAILNTTLFIQIEKTKISTAEQFNQWLATKNSEGNPVYVWYKLATPTKLACTPEQTQVLEQLYNSNTYRPVTNIFTLEDLANLKLNYVADSKIYVDNKINAMQANLNTINQLLSTTGTSALLLNNMQTDLESEVM